MNWEEAVEAWWPEFGSLVDTLKVGLSVRLWKMIYFRSKDKSCFKNKCRKKYGSVLDITLGPHRYLRRWVCSCMCIHMHPTHIHGEHGHIYTAISWSFQMYLSCLHLCYFLINTIRNDYLMILYYAHRSVSHSVIIRKKKNFLLQ